MSIPTRRDTLGVAEEAATWLIALEDADDATRAAFVKWLRGSPRHVEEFLLVTASDRAMQNMDRHRRMDVERMIAQLNANVVPLDEAAERANDGSPGNRQSASSQLRSAEPGALRNSWRPVALAATVLLAIGWWLAVFGLRDTYTTAVGEQRTVQLADGSLIYLNARSRIAVRLSDERRDVRLLEGEALFKVAHDVSRPFTVASDRAVIRAVGTQFNVDRRSQDTRVAVIEGAVEITLAKRASAATQGKHAAPNAHPAPALTQLAAGEEVRIASSGLMTRSKGNVADAIAWRERRLVFSDSTLEEIATEFNRYNRKQQLVIADESLRDQRYGGTFEADEPRALIEFLRRTPGLAVEDEGGRIVIRRSSAGERAQ